MYVGTSSGNKRITRKCTGESLAYAFDNWTSF